MSEVRAGAKVATARQTALLVAVCVGSGLAHIGTSTMPFQIGALVDGSHRSASEAGFFGFAQVAALAAGMILMSAWIDRVHPRRVAIAGSAFAALANVGLFLVHPFYLQIAFAILSGSGYGLVFAATVAGAAVTSQPDRVYAIGNGGALLLIVGILTTLPAAAAHFGPLGIFVALALLAVVSAPSFLGFTYGRRPAETRLAAWHTPGAPGLLFAWAAYSAGAGGLYAFSERIGRSIALAPTQIAFVLSTGVFVGLLGTGAAALLGRNVNRRWALIVGIAGSGLSCLLTGFSTNLLLFGAGVFAYWIFTMFLYSYLLGTAAILDSTGRVGTLGGGVERLGYAVGAGVAGVLADHISFASTGVLGFVGCALGLFVGFPNLFRALAHAPKSSLTL
jgi:predicted MFS family arabinose efflux permease